jgi:DNA-directed RNA polymerase subunit RPC12/RpoP
MKLEETEETEDGEACFCDTCGQQLFTIDEIAQRICYHCKKEKGQQSDDTTFCCWACGEPLKEMSEVAQGVCNHCKASIIRKLDVRGKKR